MRITKAQVGRIRPLPFEWPLTQERSEVESAARARSTRRTGTAGDGALLCDFLSQLHGTLHTGYLNGVPLFSVVIFKVERSKGHTDYSDKRRSDLLPRRCEQVDSLYWVRVILALFPPPDSLVLAVRSPVTR